MLALTKSFNQNTGVTTYGMEDPDHGVRLAISLRRQMVQDQQCGILSDMMSNVIQSLSGKLVESDYPEPIEVSHKNTETKITVALSLQGQKVADGYENEVLDMLEDIDERLPAIAGPI